MARGQFMTAANLTKVDERWCLCNAGVKLEKFHLQGGSSCDHVVVCQSIHGIADCVEIQALSRGFGRKLEIAQSRNLRDVKWDVSHANERKNDFILIVKRF